MRTDLYTTLNTDDSVVCFVDGKMELLNATRNGVCEVPIVNMIDGTQRTVDLINSKQNYPSSGTWLEQILDYGNGSTSIVAPTRNGRSIVFIGDSICVGNDAYTPSVSGFTGVLRMRNWDTCNIVVEAMASQRLSYMEVDDPNFENLIERLTDYSPTDVYVAIGMNDFNGYSYSSIADFKTAYQRLISGIKTALPSATIWLQSIIPPATVPNPVGWTDTDFRLAVSQVAISESCTYIDGSLCATRSDMGTGNHPTNAGYLIYANYIAPILGIT